MMARCKLEFWLVEKADHEKSGVDHSMQSVEACAVENVKP